MFTPDLLIILLVVIQPSIIGILLFSFGKYVLYNKTLLGSLKNARKRYKGARFFECSTYPRLIGKFKFDIQALTFVVIFLVYDVDLIFFLPEIFYSDFWSRSELILFILIVVFFILGLIYDITQQNFNWSY